ncbi:hypothetical protein [uncultured Acetobacteroides sp.]|uniref:hypothetical protein n=1 Tax=uncultured Acetobacteroides sp. TaxID=1760811 RepID=UPI0029F4D0AB|nr:hypothetical protein [uncultured Acetobacteroides sp.]
MEYVKEDIRNQIQKTNRAFTNYWGKLQFEGLLSEDIDTLTAVLKKVTRGFQLYRVMAIVIASVLVVISLQKYFDMLESVDLNRAGVFIIMAIVFLQQVYINYKVKVNLENKIYLLELLKKIERK